MLVVAGVRLPQFVDQSLVLLGNARAGVALFAIGIVMFCRSVSLTPTVALNVLARMVVVPARVWLAMAGLGLSVGSLREAVLVMALPAAALPVIFAVRFQTAQQEMASTLFYANIAAIPTLGAFIWLTSDGNLAKM
jgi:predicted permease